MAEHIYLCQQWIASQSSAFKSEYLPVGYEEGDVEAILSVVGFLRNLVKHERTLLRNLSVQLLTNIKRESGRERVGAVPKLGELYLVIERGLRTRDSVRSIETIQRQWTSHLKIRVALLRMVTAHHYFHRPPGDASSQWDVIDDYLEILRTWGLVQKQVREMIEDINRQDIHLPTKDEVEELRVSMATQGAGAVNQLLNDETAAS
ncbi:hypothetical protein VP01_8336g1 [Puccinia sorghi]|uniref:Uncharacterized protein n=1 Tax=Puccinia sorghi TaxID=27349 RepID=A0A0L6U9L3_9BASI|nr:hypothetical protein VP01_8336g1 [Puccinia sorghi]